MADQKYSAHTENHSPQAGNRVAGELEGAKARLELDKLPSKTIKLL